jgi:hypothetical protein
MSKAGKLLERMKEIAKIARETLLDEDRVELQVEMGRLQHELDRDTEVLKAKLAGDDEYAKVLMRSSFENTETYKMLQRARERVQNGENWNVAEIATPILKQDAESMGLMGYSLLGYEWDVTDDPLVPTLGEMLNAKGRSVMDSASAVVSYEELGKEIEGLIKQRVKLVGYIEQNGGLTPKEEEANFDALHTLVSGVARFLSSLARDMVEIVTGPPKDEDGNYIVTDDPLPVVYLSQEGLERDESRGEVSEFDQKTGTNEIEALKLQVQLSARPLVGANYTTTTEPPRIVWV